MRLNERPSGLSIDHIRLMGLTGSNQRDIGLVPGCECGREGGKKGENGVGGPNGLC